MRLKTIVALVLPMLALTCTHQGENSTRGNLKLETTREKFSYSLGYDFGPNMENIKSGLDLQMFMHGLEDYLNGKPALVPLRERQDIRSREFTRIGEEYIAQQKAEEQKRLQDGEAFLAENKTKSGVITTASGLQYMILSEGSGPHPGPDDRIKVKYRGTLIDGKEFESTEKLLGRPSTFLVKGVFPGWTEGFQLMCVGGKYRFFIHPDLAYGKIGRRPDIPPNATLIYDFELLEIVTGKE
ncbi:MAG: FKBP-type peptidyl-prolyl cis-trans isomerase N-terminal domain-containing protein [bacterium]